MNQSRGGVYFVSEPRSWVNAEARETKTGWPWGSHVCKLYLCLGGAAGLQLAKSKLPPKLLFPCLVDIPLLYQVVV